MTTPLLELRAVAKSFGKLQVINGLSFRVAQGETLGVLGPNGAGKTTMFGLIGGDFAPSAGQILLKGQDLAGVPAQQRCRLGVGRTYQIPRPFAGITVFENLLVGATYGRGRSIGDSRELCRQILRDTGLLAKADLLAGQLGLLERKRLELARALATAPELLLLDEIAGGLTEHEVRELLEVIAAIRARGVTIIWIEHIVHALAAVVDRILVINFGSALIAGPPQQVLARRELQEVYLGVELE
jgi:branched-chain amino acid transport system ATP-binding protein